jgi:hypothetical protein
MMFKDQGKCAANTRVALDLNTPSELLHLDVLHKSRLTTKVDNMQHGRFNTAPRDFFMNKAITRSNTSVASRLFLDPYHVADGNLWGPNFREKYVQRGGAMTSHSARSAQLTWEREPIVSQDPQRRARSKYLTPPEGRFAATLKPHCARSLNGPDPYNTQRRMTWCIRNTGYVGGDDGSMGKASKVQPVWSTYALTRRQTSL